jgi:hypothetical protein
MTPATHIAEQIKRVLQSLGEPAAAPYLSDWPNSYERRPSAHAELPVLRWLPQIAADTAAYAAELVAAVAGAAPALSWRQTYSAQEAGAAFLDNYGWSEILGASGPIICERLAGGFLLLGPSTHYQRHHHAAEEIYLPLSGTADWQQGDENWRERSPGTLIHHSGDEPHAMRTHSTPMLALYLWRGAGLTQKARAAWQLQ